MEATTRLIDLTVGELVAIINSTIDAKMNTDLPKVEVPEKEKPLFGIDGIAEALHCSRAKAQRMKAEGLLEGGYQQIGQGIIIESARKLRDIAEMSLKKKKRKNIIHK